MQDNVVLEWLFENNYRCYPLKVTANNEIVLKGVGTISITDSVVSISNNNAFTNQLIANDSIEITVDSTVYRYQVRVVEASKLYLYDSSVNTDRSYEFNIIKSGSFDDGLNSRDGSTSLISLNNNNIFSLILDANIVIDHVVTDVTLDSFAIFSGNLVVTIDGGNQTFTIANYQSLTEPYYCRNNQGSLLVVSPDIGTIPGNMTFNNLYFENSVVHSIYDNWKGVSSIEFKS